MKKILIVDDQPEVLELVKATLDIGQYHLLFAQDASQALKLIGQEMPDLVVLDVKLSGSQLDGLEICCLLKNNPETKHIKIIMVSARGQQQDVMAGLLAGSDEYISKPFSPTVLASRVKRLLGKGG